MKTKSLLKLPLMLVLIFGLAISCDGDNDSLPDEIAVDTRGMNFFTSGGSNSFTITAPTYVAWAIDTDADWLTLTSEAGDPIESGLASATINVNADANLNESEKTALITVYTTTTQIDIEVTQDFRLSTIDADASEMSDFTAVQLTGEMGVGWNIGNSLDAVGGETAWGNPPVNKDLIDAVKAAGFNTVRIPIAWSNYIEEGDPNYTISHEGLTRVEEVINYVLENDMFAIINIHYDGGWMNEPTYERQDYINDRLDKMWKQIAIYFRDYDYHLVFAGTNEVLYEGDYSEPTEEYYTVQNSFNETFINTVRETGGRNAYRFLTIQGFNTNIDHAVNYAVIPEDTVEDRMLMEVHYYDPYDFTLNVENDDIWQWGSTTTDPSATAGWGEENHLETQFQKVEDAFVANGLGVILGEYGASARLNVEGHKAYREDYVQKVTASALSHGMVPVIWDNGYTDDHNMGLFRRSTGEEIFPDLIDAVTEN
tara:strand:+ start:56849 stop:58297 length:1449 start_codon:yes stop_codon:yes gene_type:complete